MYQIGLGLEGIHTPLDGQKITARGLHGLLHHVLSCWDESVATWLHHHAAPKPYTLAPYYDVSGGCLAGLRLSALTDEVAQCFYTAWEYARMNGRLLRLGAQKLRVNQVVIVDRGKLEALSNSPPITTISLRFLAPTTFKQVVGSLPLPLPYNVFRSPAKIWKAYAPMGYHVASDWLQWCEKNVFIVEHDIQTVPITVGKKQPPLCGFVGDVSFKVLPAKARQQKNQLSILHAFARLAELSGVGYKTTMGFGAVEIIQTDMR